MMVFFGAKMKVAIPESRIYKIVLNENSITMYYDGGDIININDYISAPAIEDITFKFDTEELALETFRSYYEACEKGKNAFYFS